jgi:uncharacterized protein (TIGR03382 family)
MNRDRVKHLGQALSAPALLAVMVIVFLWPIVLPPPGQAPGAPSPQGSDIVAQFYPWSRIFAEGVRRGQLVLWNPYSFLGKPFQAHPQAAEFYPVTWLFVVMDANAAFGVALTFHLWLAAFGIYTLARTFGISKPGALLSGVTFVFGGFVTSKIFVGFHDIFGTMAWMPWAMAALHWALARRRIGQATPKGPVNALSVPIGMSQDVSRTP